MEADRGARTVECCFSMEHPWLSLQRRKDLSIMAFSVRWKIRHETIGSATEIQACADTMEKVSPNFRNRKNFRRIPMKALRNVETWDLSRQGRVDFHAWFCGNAGVRFLRGPDFINPTQRYQADSRYSCRKNYVKNHKKEWFFIKNQCFTCKLLHGIYAYLGLGYWAPARFNIDIYWVKRW